MTSPAPSPAPAASTSAPASPVPLFMTHHAPVGAWTSLTFGRAGSGVSIEIEGMPADSAPNADLLIVMQRIGSPVQAFPFVENAALYPGWQIVTDIRRTLTPCIDQFTAPSAGLILSVFTPQPALPNPKRSGNLQYATAPGILMELSIDNSAADEGAIAFIGLHSRGAGRLRPLDWSGKTLAGIACAGNWALAAAHVKDEVTTFQSSHIAEVAAQLLDPASSIGGILIRIPPRTSRTVPLVFATYFRGSVTQGIDARYFYTVHFPRVEAVANYLLHNRDRIVESCAGFDARAAATIGDAAQVSLFAQSVRAYNAVTQVLDASTPAGPSALFATIQRRSGRRNALDRIADRLPWELYRNPWVIRNLFDLATSTYAYHDKVRFPTDTDSPAELRDGGMSFSRDFGHGSTYSPGVSAIPGQAGMSAFDKAGAGPGWSGGNFATEVLLNSIYMLTGYALMADDTPWAKTRLPFARELLTSMENRDHWDPDRRTGILKAESAGAEGDELTAFAHLIDAPPELSRARGNLYIGMKTFCANLLLTTYFQNNNDLHSADYAYAFARKTAASLAAAYNGQFLPASLLSPAGGGGRLLAALEPFALPTFLELTSTLPEYFPELFNALKSHVAACLNPAPEGCRDPSAGALRLISTSPATCPAKAFSILFVLERLFQIDTHAELAEVWRGLIDKLQHAGARPAAMQLITSALFLKPAAS